MIKDNRCVLLLYFSGQPVFVVVPEKIEQLFILNGFWVIMNFDDFSMISAT